MRKARCLFLFLLWPFLWPVPGSRAEAGAVCKKNFDGGARTVPSDWKAYHPSFVTVEQNGSGELKISLADSGSSPGAGAAYFQGNFGPIQQGKARSVRLRARLKYGGNFFRRGIVARVQSDSPDLANPRGYYACLYRAGDIDYLEISKDPTGSHSTVLKRIRLPVLENGVYTLAFDLEEEHLQAVLYRADGETELERLAVGDESYRSGMVGVRSYMNKFSANLPVLYEAFTLEIIPAATLNP